MTKEEKSFKAFVNSRKVFTKEEAFKNKDLSLALPYNIDELDFDKLHVYKKDEESYSYSFFIEQKDNEFICLVDRSYFKFNNLAECEKHFFKELVNYLGDEIIKEFYFDYYDVYLHEQARKLMQEIDKAHHMKNTLSLDEYLHDFKTLLTEDQKQKVINLLEKF